MLAIGLVGQDLVCAQSLPDPASPAGRRQAGATPLWSHVIDQKARSADLSQPLKTSEDKLETIAIPNDSGLTRKVAVKGTDEIIINIQDAHSKLGAQESISKILDNLVKNYNLKLIALEGSSDLVDTSLVSSFPIEEVKKKTGEYLLKEGKISAGEFYSMISESPVSLYGVEDPALYKENVEVFKDLIDKKLGIRKELKNLKATIHDLEDKVYSPKLQELVSKRLLHKQGELKFTEYWDYFSQLAKERKVDYAQYSNLKKLADTVELEREIDFKKASEERDTLIKELGQKLSKVDLERLVLSALQFKQSKITPGAFHYTLSQLSQGVDINPLNYKNIILYSEYVVLYESIDLIAIFDEVESFENRLKDTLYVNQDEKDLSNLTHCVTILSQLLDTSLNSKDYEFFVKNAASCEIGSIEENIGALSAKYQVEDQTDFRTLKNSIPSARKFYELASKRNQVLLENTLKKMRQEKTNIAALITGGFHSEGISKLMDDEKLSYLVVMPKFDETSPDRPYIAILTQKPKEYEEQFKDTDFYVATSSGLTGKTITPSFIDEIAVANVIGARLAGLGSSIPSGIIENYAASLKHEYEVKGADAALPKDLVSLISGFREASVQPIDRGARLAVHYGGKSYLAELTNDHAGIDSIKLSEEAESRTVRPRITEQISAFARTTPPVLTTPKGVSRVDVEPDLDKLAEMIEARVKRGEIGQGARLTTVIELMAKKLRLSQDSEKQLGALVQQKISNTSAQGARLAVNVLKSFEEQLKDWQGQKREIRRVLVNDDDSSVRRAGEMIFSILLPSAEIKLAQNSEEALALRNTYEKNGTPFDLILTDRNTGTAMTGTALIQQVRALEASQNRPENKQSLIILYSGDIDVVNEELKQKNIDISLFGPNTFFLSKPAALAAFKAFINLVHQKAGIEQLSAVLPVQPSLPSATPAPEKPQTQMPQGARLSLEDNWTRIHNLISGASKKLSTKFIRPREINRELELRIKDFGIWFNDKVYMKPFSKDLQTEAVKDLNEQLTSFQSLSEGEGRAEAIRIVEQLVKQVVEIHAASLAESKISATPSGARLAQSSAVTVQPSIAALTKETLFPKLEVGILVSNQTGTAEVISTRLTERLAGFGERIKIVQVDLSPKGNEILSTADFLNPETAKADRILFDNDLSKNEAFNSAIERVTNALKNQQEKLSQSLQAEEAVLGFLANVLNNPEIQKTLIEKGVESTLPQLKLDELKTLLYSLKLQPPAPYFIEDNQNGVPYLVSAGIFLPTGFTPSPVVNLPRVFEPEKLEDLVTQAFKSRGNDSLKAIKEALDNLLPYLGQLMKGDAHAFDQGLETMIRSFLSGYKNAFEAQNRLSLEGPEMPPIGFEGSILTYAKEGTPFEVSNNREVAAIREQIAGKKLDVNLNQIRVIPVDRATLESPGYRYESFLAEHLKRYPELAKYSASVIFVPSDLKTASAIMNFIQTDTHYRQMVRKASVFVDEERTLELGAERHGHEVYLLQLHPDAKMATGALIVGAKVLFSAGEIDNIPGLVRIGKNTYIYLPIISAYELLELLINTNKQLRAIGSAA